MAQVLALICATSTPGTMRSKSGILVAPERRMSSAVITKMAEAVRESVCDVLETEVTLNAPAGWSVVRDSAGGETSCR